MKIDCHVHLLCLSEKSGGYTRLGWLRNLMKPLLARRLGVFPAESAEDKELLYIAVLSDLVRESELDRAVVLAFDEVYNKDGTRNEKLSRFFVPNDFARDATARHPNTFLFGASVHPYRPDALECLEKVKEEGAALVKLLPNTHGYDPADKGLLPYYKKLAALRLPLLQHAGFEHTIPTQNQAFGDPERLRVPLDEGVTVVVAHAGSAGMMHRKETFGTFLKLSVQYPNCFGDTSALCNIWRAKYLKELLHPEIMEKKYGVKIEYPFEKLIHGSDFPIPVTPLAHGQKAKTEALRSVGDKKNPLAVDIALKRTLGVPDACLTSAHEVLGISAPQITTAV